jgi:hypothetical protein
MFEKATHFEFTCNLALVTAEKRIEGNREVYTLNFSNEIPPVQLAGVKQPSGQYIWDTIPPGNKELADAMGTLIEQYYREQDEKA